MPNRFFTQADYADEVDQENPDDPKKRRFFTAPESDASTLVRQEPDVGVVGAFTSGVKEGLLAPLTVFGREDVELNLDERGEKIANFAGEMVGLGIGFVPFLAGTGMVLRGAGLTRMVSKPVYDFVRFSLAGTAQAAGTAEDVGDIPKQAAIGFAFGAVFDGMLLARAMGRRATDIAKKSDELISPELLAKEIEIRPDVGDSDLKAATTVAGLQNEAKSYEQIIADLTDVVTETARIPGLAKADDLIAYTQSKLPNAQILRRRVIGNDVEEVLIHNPIDESDRLTPKQIKQYEQTGTFEGLEVIYGGNRWRATGKALESSDRIQLKKGNVVYAPLRSDVSIALTPRVFTEKSMRYRLMQNALQAADRIGFTSIIENVGDIRVRGRGGRPVLQRGTVDIGDFEEYESMHAFIQANKEHILQIEAPSLEDAAAIFANRMGIRGIVERLDGRVSKLHIFDQESVNYLQEPLALNTTADNLVMSQGKGVLTVEPTWSNVVKGTLREAGFQQKEIDAFLDKYLDEAVQRLDDIMDDEFKTIARSSQLQFSGGCV